MEVEILDDDEVVVANPLKYPFLNDLDLDQDVKRRLTSHLNSILLGSNEVYLTPICKRMEPKVILEKWDTIFSKYRDSLNKDLLAIEDANREKFGPRSIAKSWSKRKSNIESYYSPDNGDFIKHETSKANLRPLSLVSAIDSLKNDTNSGLPYYVRKSIIKSRLENEFDYLSNRNDPCILFTRTQENNKTRDVWGYPVIQTVKESMFYLPLLNYQKKLSWRKAIVHPNDTDIAVTKLLDRASKTGLTLVSIDFKGYDTSIKRRLIRSAFSYIKAKFQSKFHRDIDNLCEDMITIGLLTPDGVLRGDHGVPSGSTFTNEVDSIVQYLIAKASGFVMDTDMQIQGDDGLYIVDTMYVDEFISYFESYGLKVNKEKTDISKEYCIYLQKFYHAQYRQDNGVIGGIYSVYRALNRIIHQERWSTFEKHGLLGKDYYSLRTISILENCKYHPAFTDLVKFIYDIDKYSLKYSKEGLSKYVGMLNDDKAKLETLYNQYGNDSRGIKSFSTVKILQSLG